MPPYYLLLTLFDPECYVYCKHAYSIPVEKMHEIFTRLGDPDWDNVTLRREIGELLPGPISRCFVTSIEPLDGISEVK